MSKTYTVTITAKGGPWIGKRSRYTIEVEASSKPEAADKALDEAEKELKSMREEYDSLHVTKICVK